MSAVAMSRDFVTKGLAGRVTNHTVRRMLTGKEVQHKSVQDSSKNRDGTVLGMTLSRASNNAWNKQVLWSSWRPERFLDIQSLMQSSKWLWDSLAIQFPQTFSTFTSYLRRNSVASVGPRTTFCFDHVGLIERRVFHFSRGQSTSRVSAVLCCLQPIPQLSDSFDLEQFRFIWTSGSMSST